MAIWRPKQVGTTKIDAATASIIYAEYKKLRTKKRISQNTKFKDWFDKNEQAIEIMFAKPVPQLVNASTNYILKTARDMETLQINGHKVSLNQFEQAIDKFEAFMYTNFDGVANIRYKAEITLKQNILNLKLPPIKLLSKIKKKMHND